MRYMKTTLSSADSNSNNSLEGLLGYADQDVAYVQEPNHWFRFFAASTATPDGSLIISPDDITPPAPGRWFRQGAPAQYAHNFFEPVGITPGIAQFVTYDYVIRTRQDLVNVVAPLSGEFVLPDGSYAFPNPSGISWEADDRLSVPAAGQVYLKSFHPGQSLVFDSAVAALSVGAGAQVWMDGVRLLQNRDGVTAVANAGNIQARSGRWEGAGAGGSGVVSTAGLLLLYAMELAGPQNIGASLTGTRLEADRCTVTGVNSTLTINGSGNVVRASNTQFEADGGMQNAQSDVALEGCTLTSTGASPAFINTGSARGSLRGCTIRNTGTGGALQAAGQLSVDDCLIQGSASASAVTVNGGDVTFNGGRVEQNDDSSDALVVSSPTSALYLRGTYFIHNDPANGLRAIRLNANCTNLQLVGVVSEDFTGTASGLLIHSTGTVNRAILSGCMTEDSSIDVTWQAANIPAGGLVIAGCHFDTTNPLSGFNAADTNVNIKASSDANGLMTETAIV